MSEWGKNNVIGSEAIFLLQRINLRGCRKIASNMTKILFAQSMENALSHAAVLNMKTWLVKYWRKKSKNIMRVYVGSLCDIIGWGSYMSDETFNTVMEVAQNRHSDSYHCSTMDLATAVTKLAVSAVKKSDLKHWNMQTQLKKLWGKYCGIGR